MNKDLVKTILIDLGVPVAILISVATGIWHYMDSIRGFVYPLIQTLVAKPVPVTAPATNVTIKQTLVAQPVTKPSPQVVVKIKEVKANPKKVARVSSSKIRILCNQPVYKGTPQCSK